MKNIFGFSSKVLFVVFLIAAMAVFFVPNSASATPYPQSSTITGISWGSIQPARGVESDLWINTWANDGNIYAGWGDGWGFGGETSGLCQGDKPYIGISKITGSGSNWSGSDIFCGGRWAPSNTHPQGKPIGMIAVGNTLYMGVTQQDVWTKYKILKSTDYGKTWYQSNGGLWDDNLWDFNSANGEVMPAFIERGPGYSTGPSDGYVYGVMDSENSTGKDLYLARVPKDQIMTRSSYRYFAGLSGGNPTWTADAMQKKSIFYDANGTGWGSMISYVPSLNRYLLTAVHNYNASTYLSDGSWGLFDGPNPWGPWTTVAYYTTATNPWRDSCPKFNLSFPQKWMSTDGKSLYMTFSGSNSLCGQTYDAFRVIPITLTTGTTPTPTPTPIKIQLTGWTWCAYENNQCSFTGTKEVRFGTATQSYTKTLSTSTPCTNVVFGDPAPGSLKQCHYRDTTIPTPTPTSTNTPPAATITNPSSTTTTVNLGSTINFSANISDPDSSTINMKWYIDRMGDGILWALIKEENKAPGTTSGTVTMSGTRTNTDGQTISLQDTGATYELVLEVSDGVNPVVTTKRVFTLTSSTPTNTLCHLLTSANTTPTGYGASYNPLTTAKELLMNVLCQSTSATITLGKNSNTIYL